ncbi:MAG: hypothetical protein CMJ18_13125 [Phycisphaeraceae bacterium]|nr:hypothetical protein [Phycisphaeraceae bacterium]
MTPLELVTNQVRTARGYTRSLLKHTDEATWFDMPSGVSSHVAWQVGHLATAQFFLLCDRVRGRRDEDDQLITKDFMKLFTRGSVADADRTIYPQASEIADVFDRVHEQALRELEALDESVLDDPVEPPHPMFTTKAGAVQFASQHEFLHAGQIGMLRRLMGLESLR